MAKKTKDEEVLETESAEEALQGAGLIKDTSEIVSKSAYSPFYKDALDRGCTVLVSAASRKFRLIFKKGEWLGRWVDQFRRPGKDPDGNEIELLPTDAFEDVPMKEYAARFKAHDAYVAAKIKKERGY